MAKKIATTGTIKEVKITAGKRSISLGDLKFTTGQVEKLGDLADQKEKVKITIEQVEERLPGTG